MRRAQVLLSFAVALFIAHAPAQIQGLVTLSELRNFARPLLIFAPKPDDPQLEIQIRTLNEHSAEAADHAIVPIAIPYQNPSPTDTKLTLQDTELARQRFHVAPADFAVILLGKDGREILRSRKPLSMRRLDDAVQQNPPSSTKPR